MITDAWVKSSRSGSQGNCVEVRQSADDIQVRDSKNPAGPILTFTPDEWRTFISRAKARQFDI